MHFLKRIKKIHSHKTSSEKKQCGEKSGAVKIILVTYKMVKRTNSKSKQKRRSMSYTGKRGTKLDKIKRKMILFVIEYLQDKGIDYYARYENEHDPVSRQNLYRYVQEAAEYMLDNLRHTQWSDVTMSYEIKPMQWSDVIMDFDNIVMSYMNNIFEFINDDNGIGYDIGEHM